MDNGLRSGLVCGEAAPADGPGPVPPGDVPGGSSGGPVGTWARLRRAVAAKDTLAILDQAVVSGTSFLTTVLIGRACGAGELGVYSLGTSLLVTWACVQESLIALPYTIHRHRLRAEEEAEYAGSALLHHLLLSALALLTLAVGGAVLFTGWPVPGLADETWVLAAAMPFALVREFGRRFAFAHLRMGEALALDLAVAAVQLAGLAGLAWTGALMASTAYAAVGAACALPAGVWLYLARGQFAVRWDQVRPTLRLNWSLGKWLFASQLTVSVQAYFVHWLLAWAVGTLATGVYTACMTVVLFANPLLLGISNALAPRTAQAFNRGGGAALRRVVFQSTLLLGTAMALFCAAVFVAGEDVMRLLYHGSQYQGHGHAVAVLALGMLAAALGTPASNALAAVGRPDLVFKAGLFAVGLTVVLVPCLVAGWGVTGAAYGFLAGNLAGSLGRWAEFRAVVRREESSPASARVLPVLRQLSPGAVDRDWVVEPLNEGAQASVFAVRTQDRQPVWRTYPDVVVKVYKAAARHQAGVVRDQFRSMSAWHARLEGSTINGWRIHAPVPLYQCDQPSALVMTWVPGRSLNACLETAGQVTPETLDSIATTIVAVMERCWSNDAQTHGDLNFDNILCDLATRSLAFVDSGAADTLCLCEDVSRPWHPAARDLAHMLYETEVRLKRTLGNPGARRRQRSLAERVLRGFLERVGPAERRNGLLDEIQACAQIHLNTLRPSWTPRGVWRRLVRAIATDRIHETLAALRAAAGGPS
jgi:O-antigen/teichoic acid export membrane protein